MKKKIILSTIINFVNTAFGAAFSFVLTPVILHRIGAEQYGIWVFLGIFSIYGYFSLLDLGMQGSATKYIAEYHARGDKEKINQVVNSVLFFFLAVGIAGGCALLILNNLFLSNMFNVPQAYLQIVKILINVTALSFLFQFPAMGFAAVIEGLQRYDYLRGINILITLISGFIIFYYLKSENALFFLVAVSLTSSFLMTMAYYLISRLLLPEIKINPFLFKMNTLFGLFGLSGKLFISRLVGLVFNNTDKIVIAVFLTMTVMTSYDIVNKVHGLMLMVMSVMNQAIIPFTSRLHAINDEENLQKLFLKGTKYAVIFSLPALIFLMSLTKEFIGLWVGSEFTGLTLLTQFYLSHCFLTILTGVSSTMMVGINKVEEVLKVSVSMALVNLLISLATVKIFGINGLIAGTVISYIIGQLIFIIMFNNIFKVDPALFFNKVVFKPYLLALIMIPSFIYLKQFFAFTTIFQLIFAGLAVCFIYYGLYLLIDREERDILLRNLPLKVRINENNI